MTRVRKTHGEGFKFKVALAALRGGRTLGELSREYAVSVGAIQKWRDQLEGGGKSLFADKRRRGFKAFGPRPRREFLPGRAGLFEIQSPEGAKGFLLRTPWRLINP